MNGFMEENSKWIEPPAVLSLGIGEVHVWRIGLEQPEDLLERFRRTLEPNELERASRFHFERLQRHFVVARGFLREVLARYLEAKPDELRFAYNDYGKPSLAGEHSLVFNMSHSHEIALVGVTRGAALGIDVEHVRANFASSDIARRFFSRFEVETFDSLRKEEQVSAFFRCWTRKEAYIKAIGKGLSQALDRFDVTLAPGDPAALLRAEGEEALRWSLSDIEVGPGYFAALAVEGSISRVCYWQYIGQDLQD